MKNNRFSNRRRALMATAAVATLAMAMTACAGGKSNQANYPRKLEVIIPASPGGGWDTTARTMIDVLDKEGLYPASKVTPVNKEGGGGVTGFTYLTSRNSESVAVNSSLLITKNLLDPDSVKITPADITPIAILTTEWVTFGVKADSPYKTLKDVFDDIKKDEGKPEGQRKVGLGVGTALGTDDHFAGLQVAKLAGIEGNVPFRVYSGGGAEAVNALMSGEVDMIVGSQSEMQSQHLDGTMRILGVSADQRQPELPDVPTFQEAGFDLVFPHWRGLMGPAGMTDQELAFWDDTLGKLVKTATWEDQMKAHGWTTFYKDSKEAKTYIDEQASIFKKLTDEFRLAQ